MKDMFPQALKMVLHHEGGWADHPADPGGATMKGVTLATFSKHLGRPASKDELRAIKDEHLHEIYKKGYWDKASCDAMPAGVDLVVFDMAVNGGPGRAAKWLQEVVGVTADGAIGPGTMKAVLAEDPAELVSAYSFKRINFLQGLPTWPTFGKGWGRRVTEVASAAGTMTSSTQA